MYIYIYINICIYIYISCVCAISCVGRYCNFIIESFPFNILYLSSIILDYFHFQFFIFLRVSYKNEKLS